ncbi:GNAT family N-acetyltransferase [Kitasatospora azatica]|uniref:GNAT family N-acetyltransferase n=1 Tax=Kitasatospora azatica TaxID=58347 RepID=UPI000565BEF4|nr:GNAT family N-acetyltransferase [Kitasatospora azatica]
MTERTTPRLLLRQWRDTDLDPLAELHADPVVMRYIAAGEPQTREESARSLERFRAGWREHGFGLFAAQLRATGEFVGWVGLAVPDFLPEVLPAVEIGWRLRRQHWGQGYATEAAREVLAFGFGELGLDRLVSIYQLPNHASAHVMEKLGMVPERRTVSPGNGRAVQVTELTRADYLARHGASQS